MKNPYETLGVAQDATPEAVQAAYRKAAQRTHPDREGGSEAAFKEVGAAFDLLNNPQARASWDAGTYPGQERSEEAMAAEGLELILEQVLLTEDPVEAAASVLEERYATLANAVEEAGLLRRKLKQQAKKVKRKKAGEDLFGALVRKHLDKNEAELKELQKRIRLVKLAQGMLKDYASEKTEKPIRESPSFYTRSDLYSILMRGAGQ